MEVKPGYNQAEVEVIPEQWESTTIGDVAYFSGGSQPPRSTFKFAPTQGYVRLIQIRDYKTNEYASFIPESMARKRCTAEDIMIGRYGPPIFQILRGIEGAYNVALIKATPSQKISREFLFYVLNQEKLFQLIDSLSQRSSGQTGVEMPALKAYKISLPPLPEQRAIATVLSDVDVLLGALDQLIAKKRDLKQAAMQQLLTGKTQLPGFSGEWEETTLGQLGECVIGLTYKPENVVEHGLLVLRSSNIQNGRLAFEDNVYVSVKVPEHLYTRPGDIIICVRNGSRALIGKCALVDEGASGVTFGAFMSVYRTKYWHFLFHAFQGEDIQRQIRDNVGATINQITNKDMKAFRVKLPSVPEQTAIAAVLTDMDAELAALEQQLAKTRVLKQGMMQELLSGKSRLILPKESHA